MRTSHLIAFIAGAAVGGVATWQFVKKKYEQIAQEEIDSVKEKFSSMAKDNDAPVEEEAPEQVDVRAKAEQAREKPDMAVYAAKVRDLGYTDYSSASDKKPDRSPTRPYVISPDEFGEIDEYEKISLTYYADQVVADDDDTILENVDEVIGFDSLTHFGEYEDDSVYVRNVDRKCDYEILLDQRTYSDVLKTKPYKAEE